MLSRTRPLALLLLTCFFSSLASSAPTNHISIEDFARPAEHRDVQISPDGKFLSLILRQKGQDRLLILDRNTRKPLRGFKTMNPSKGIGEVHWVSNKRLVYSLTQHYYWDKEQRNTGELVGVNVDGSQHVMLFGHSAGERSTGTKLKKKRASYGGHEVIDLLREDENHILIAFYPWKVQGNFWVHDRQAYPQIQKLNVLTGQTQTLEHLPLKNAFAVTDNTGLVRFAGAINDRNQLELAYKKNTTAPWHIFSPEKFEGVEALPHGFSPDNQKVYLSANKGQGTRALYLFDLSNDSFVALYQDKAVDISHYVKDFKGRHIVAVGTELQLPKYHYLDTEERSARLHQMLMKSFKGFNIRITAVSRDERFVSLFAYSDFNPGDYYLFDTQKLQADFLLAGHPNIDINKTRTMLAKNFVARDGVTLHGYLTLPYEGAKNLPLVVIPHGGPHGVRDYWGYDWETQLLASQGYAVMQVNYRGSGGFGLAFQKAGYGQWGALMQDDVTDATHSLIHEGIADPQRICIYGASYGGYAALMGAIREPQLYQCAIGAMGIYSLPMMFEAGDIADRKSGLAYLKSVLGTNIQDQKARSPVFNVEKINAGLMLIHGVRDKRAPIEQALALKSALDSIDKPYQWLELSDEGHGYFDETNRVQVYRRILAFLESYIGDAATSRRPAMRGQ